MRVVSNKALSDFAAIHPKSKIPLQVWRKLIESSDTASFAQLKALMNSVDRVGDFHVFDIGGNKYRVVAAVHFNRQMLFVRHVFTHAEYEAAVASMNRLLDLGAADENHPLANLVATMGELIGDYDDAHYPAPEVTGVQMLKFLMDQHGLKQGDLPEIGTQGVVSEILSGKRDLNVRQVKKLKLRFGVSADAFV